nr:nAChR subunit (ShAR1 beta2) [Hymenolepis microstoma]
MSRKSKAMKRRLLAKKMKRASSLSADTAAKAQALGIKNPKKKEIKKGALKSFADKSVTPKSHSQTAAISNKNSKKKAEENKSIGASKSKVKGKQQKLLQATPLPSAVQSAPADGTSMKKKRKRNRKRKASVSISQCESNGQQPATKRPRVESVNAPAKSSSAFKPSAKQPKHKAEEEASSDSEPEPIHSDWRLNDSDDSEEEENDVEPSFADDDEEDLDTSEDDVDEEPVKISEGSSDEDSSETSEDSDESDSDSEDNDTQDVFDEATSDSSSSRYLLNLEYPDSDDTDADFVPVNLFRVNSLGTSATSEEESLDSSEEANSSETSDTAEEESSESSEETSVEEGYSQEYDLNGIISRIEDSRIEKALIKKSKKTEKVTKSKEAADSASALNTRVSKKRFSLSNKSTVLSEMKKRSAEFDKRCLYIAPIPSNCTFAMIKKFVPKVQTCQFFTKPKSDKLRTYSFLEFADAETAKKERLSIMGRIFAGKSLRAELRSGLHTFDGKTVSDIDFSRIIVTGLTPDVNLMDLKTIFPSAESVTLPRLTDFNLGHATVKFVSDSVALDAFSQCHRFPLKSHPITVNFAFKQPSDKIKPTTATPSATVVAPSSKSSKAKDLSSTTQSRAERVGKVLVQQMNGVSEKKSGKKVEEKKSGFGLMELIKSKKRMTEDHGDDASDSEEEAETCDENEDSDDGVSEEVEDDDDDDDETNDDDDDENDDGSDTEDDLSSSKSDEESSDDEVDDSEGEELDAQLEQVLLARKASAKALKKPGAKRNWMAANIKQGKKRPAGAMPKVLPVPSKHKK